jgi:hypothetical protein
MSVGYSELFSGIKSFAPIGIFQPRPGILPMCLKVHYSLDTQTFTETRYLVPLQTII